MANSSDIIVPDLGEFANVEVIEILVSAGDKVEREDGLITLETDKAAMDVPATENGVIESITVSLGDKVSAGSVIGKMIVEVGDIVVIMPAIAAMPTNALRVRVRTMVLTAMAPVSSAKERPSQVRAMKKKAPISGSVATMCTARSLDSAKSGPPMP